MSASLSFNDITLSPVTHQNSLWIRATELARALGYKQENSISRLYRSNADEFSPDMTQVIEIPAESRFGSSGNLSDGRCRIFSLRGCHLLAMFARTPVAKAFRKWVLDVIEQYGEQVPVEQPVLVNPTSTITASHQAQLKAIVDAKVGMLPSDVQRKAYAEIWSRFSRHFQIARYQQLPSERVGEAISYLVEMRIEERKPLSQGKESKALSASGTMPIEFEPPCPMPVEDDISQAFRRARAVTEYLKALKLQIHVPCRVQTASLSFLNNRKEIELYKALDKQIDYSLCSLDSATCALESAWHLSKFMQEERKSVRP